MKADSISTPSIAGMNTHQLWLDKNASKTQLKTVKQAADFFNETVFE